MKLELVQYPYSKSGPTVYLDDYQIAGPRALGVLSSPYEATKVLCLNAIASRADTIANQINDTIKCEQVLF